MGLFGQSAAIFAKVGDFSIMVSTLAMVVLTMAMRFVNVTSFMISQLSSLQTGEYYCASVEILGRSSGFGA